MKIDEAKYKSDFGIEPENRKKLEAALEHALDIRKFEIELYWKRATYFWALIASTFAGYFVILGAEHLVDKKFLAFIVACVGFLFTFALFQVNRGSKQWQENWENHVDILEDKVIGPLHKTVLGRSPDDTLFESHFTGPSNISVSKTNQIVNLFTLCIWFALACVTLDIPWYGYYPSSIKHVAIFALTLIFCIIIHRNGRTHPGNHNPVAKQRRTVVNFD